MSVCLWRCLLQGDEKRVYEFIVRHFLACCSQDAQGHETTIEIDINGEQVRYRLLNYTRIFMNTSRESDCTEHISAMYVPVVIGYILNDLQICLIKY